MRSVLQLAGKYKNFFDVNYYYSIKQLIVKNTSKKY